jgi:hypothetical protein
VDTAPASGFRSALGLALQGRWLNIFQRMAIALAAVAALSWIGFTIPFILLNLIRVFGTLTGAWLLMSEAWRQLGGRGDYSPGAVDNASGVGLLLAMAEQFAEMPPEGLRPGFLFTGAEETGMHGARSFASGLEPGQKDQLFVLNVDMVGAGDVLRVVTSEGIIKKRLTDPRLNRILFEAAPAARGLRAINRSGDFAPFLEAGIPVASIEISGSTAAARAYHSVHDELDLVETTSLAKAAEVVGEFVRILAEG